MTMNMVAVLAPDFNELNSCRFMNVDLKQLLQQNQSQSLNCELRLAFKNL